MFERATRKKSKLRLALTGVSGAGKTLGALYIAYGITGDWGKIAVIDTEHGRARFYAERSDLEIPTGAFLYQELTAPYSPARYIKLIDMAQDAVGEDGCIIIDSLSHAWNAEGGVLEIVQGLAKQTGKNSYTAWNEGGQEQNTLINALFTAQCHTIITLRSKMEYAMEMNERGKQQPVKIGLAPIQRNDVEYEFDIVLQISRNHIASASKDVTFFEGWSGILTPEIGSAIAQWLDNGAEPDKCSECGKTIMGAQGRSAEQIVTGSMQHAGRKMCVECFRKWSQLDKGRAAQIEAAGKAVPEGIHPADLSEEEYQELLK